MAPRKKPDATDTEPPEEARPNTTATPLPVEDGKLIKSLAWISGCEVHSDNASQMARRPC